MADYFQEMGWTPLGDSEAPDFFLQMARFLRDSGMWEYTDEHRNLPPPASKEAVDNLEEIEFRDDSGGC